MNKINFDLKGGQANDPFTCTGCKQERNIGMDYLEVHLMGKVWGPVCLECWYKVPKMFETVAQHPGVSIDVEAIREQVMARYQAAKARGN